MIRFAQISDTHLPGDPPNAFLERVCREMRNPWDTLEMCLTELAAEPVDFVLHAGDVLHEGAVADYRRVQRLFAERLPGVPVVWAPGNHDRREVFAEVVPGAVCLGEDEYVQDILLPCGVRVLVLDTLRKAVADPLSEAQLDWLEARLADPTPEDVLLLMHHPPIWQDPIFAVPVTERFVDLAAHPKVKALFAGHTHQNMCTQFAGKPLYVADSMAVGMKSKKGAVTYYSRAGYHICDVDETGGVAVENRLLFPQLVHFTK